MLGKSINMLKIKELIKTNSILVIILILAASLRFIGLNPGFNQFHPDEGISYSSAVEMIRFKFDPKRYDYPALVPAINYFSFNLFFIPINWVNFYITHFDDFKNGNVSFPLTKNEERKIFQENILGHREINALFWGRVVTAVLGLGGIFLTYLLGKNLFNKKVGLIAAFLLTFNFKHAQNSHIGLPDIYNSFFLLLSLLLTLYLWKKGSLKSYLLAGFGIGLFFSIKYQIFAFFPFLFVHFLNSVEKNKIHFKKLIRPALFMALIVTLITFIVINPHFFINLDKAVKAITGVSQKYAMGRNQLNLYPLWYFYHIDYGFLELLVAGFGIIVALKKYLKKATILLSILVPFFYVFLYYSNGGFYVRNFITVTPLILVFAGFGTFSVYNFIGRKFNYTLSLIILILMLAMMIYIPGKNAGINSYYYTKPWGYDVLKNWEEINLPEKVTIAAHPFDPIPDSKNVKRTEFEIDGNYSLAEHKEVNALYALMNLDWAGNPFYFWMGPDILKYTGKLEKPLDLMRNTYHGLAAEELFRYQIFSVTKPWQASDANLILAKIPDWSQIEMRRIQGFNFDGGLEGWVTEQASIDSFGFDEKVGKRLKGSVIYFPGKSSSPNKKISSLPIKIKSGHLYKITGFLKTEQKLSSSQREGFLRIDFYNEDIDLNKVGMISSVSSRVYGIADWSEKEVAERAPEGSKYLVISFQVGNSSYKLWLDDVIVWESKESIKDVTSRLPYIKKVIDLNLLYPNSHGNL